jgi:hypothetical protein
VDVRTWDTRQAPDPAFAAAWTTRLARAPHASFSLRADFLAWDAQHGRPALAVLVEDPPGMLVLRRVRGGWSSGWAWRPQMVAEAPPPGPLGLSDAQRRGLLAAVDAVTHGALTRCFVPAAAIDGEPAFVAAETFVHGLDRSEDELFATFDGNRRRAVKKAAKEGWAIVEATTPGQFHGFALLQAEISRRRGVRVEPVPEAVARSGESWREWELPWMRLFVAVRDGQVGAGSGFGFVAGAAFDYRANASDATARAAGANVALAWEALRAARVMGCRSLNWGGATEFKKNLGGERVAIWCRLGGGPVWALPNRMTLSWHRVRPRIAGLWKSLQRRGAAS